MQLAVTNRVKLYRKIRALSSADLFFQDQELRVWPNSLNLRNLITKQFRKLLTGLPAVSIIYLGDQNDNERFG